MLRDLWAWCVFLSVIPAVSMQQTQKNAVSICNQRFFIPVLWNVQVKLHEHWICIL